MFVELLSKTNFSFLEGASHPEEMVARAKELGYLALGICDKNGVYGIPKAHSGSKQVGIRLIIGAELTVVFGEKKSPATLIAKSKQGYGDLCELLTELHARDEPEIPAARLLQTRDLFLLLPPQEIEEALLSSLKETFGDGLYLIASRFHDGKDKRDLEQASHFSKRYELPCIASNQPLYHVRKRKPLQDVLTCIRHTCTLQTAGFRLLPNAERFLKSPAEVTGLFKDYPQWIENTQRIAESCQFSLSEVSYRYPSEWLPPGETGDSYLEKLVWENVSTRYPENPLSPVIRRQIHSELSLIKDLNYSDYFLTIWDIVQFARREKIVCQGRGSAANSLVCYILGITAIDPIRMELLFERFISRERQEPPDIDIDFEHERREEVIQYIYGRYGRHRAAITAEVICYRKKSSLREVAKVFDIPFTVVEQIAVSTHREKLSTISTEDLHALAPDLSAKTVRQFFTIVQQIEGFPRHVGTHVGGFILCDDNLSRLVPVQKAAMPNRTIIQWDKYDLDALNFVKVDVLGLGILTCIRKTFEIIEEKYGKKYDLATIPPEDPNIYRSIQASDTVGVFQIESRAQMNMLPRLKPRNFFDLVVEISLVRPGPIQGEMVHPYLRRRAGLEPVEYAHPELESILKKTYGVPLFQEQIMKMAMTVAGFSPGEADELRRAMGTWRHHGGNRLSHMGNKFCAGLMKKGIPQEFAQKIFSQIEGFAEYGFPESHAASFAILAYASAYLRFYYPDAYLCAILNSQPMGFYRGHSLIHDGERHGVKIRNVDVNFSKWDNQVEEKGYVRLGFREIRGFSTKVGEAITALREKKRFENLLDFTVSLKSFFLPSVLTKRDLFLLGGANAFESMGLERRRAWWEIQALPLQDSRILPTEEGQVLLPQEKDWEHITLDYQAKGVSLFAHPMEYFRQALEKSGVISSKSLRRPGLRFLKPKQRVRVAGVVICRQMPPTASGVLFITLEDEHGFINLVIWNKVYQQYKECLITQSFLYAEGRLEKTDGADVIHIIVDRARSLINNEGFTLPSHDFG